jgi:succinoglycan biosynthesis transport protein ExoP
MQRESTSGFELGLAIWRRRKWLAVVAFATVLAVTVSLARALPDLYRAKATVLIERQQVSEAFVRPSVTAELETRIQTIRQEIMSRTRVIDLIARFNLYPDLRDRRPVDEIVDRMRKDIQLNPIAVDQLSGRAVTIAFTVSYLGRDPQIVADVANTLAAMYVEENTTVRGRQATRTAEFLGAQLTAIKQEMDAQERLADDFKLRHIGELPQQMEANLASL